MATHKSWQRTRKTSEARVPRTSRQTADALDQVLHLQREQNWSDAQTCGLLGYSFTALTGWRKAGKAPLTAGLAACEVLRRSKPNGRVLVVRTGPDAGTVVSMLKLAGCAVYELE